MSSPLRQIIAAFGIDVDDEQLEEADKKIDSFIDKLKDLATGAGVVEATKKIFEFAEHLSEFGDQLDKGAIRLGISTDALQELGFAAKQSGSDIESITTGLLMLQDKVGDALVNASGEGAKAFAKYGIAIKDANGKVKSADQLFSEVADKIADTTDAAKQVTIATDLFGKKGRELLPTLKEGKDGIAELRAEFVDLGGGFSKEAVEASRDYDDALGRLGVTFTSLKGRIALVLLPWLQKAVDAFTHIVAKFVEFAGKSRIIETTLAAIGAALTFFAVKSVAAFGPFLLTVAAVGLALLALEDVVSFFAGDKSLLGEAIDTIFGAGEAAKVSAKGMELLTLWWRGLKAEVMFVVHAIEKAIETFEKLYAFAQKVGIKVATAAGLDTPEKRQAAKDKAIDTVGNVAGSVGGFYANAYGKIGKGISSAVDFVGDKANALVGPSTPVAESRPVAATPANVTQQVTLNPSIVISGAQDKEATLRQLDEWWAKTTRQASDSLLPIAEPAQ